MRFTPIYFSLLFLIFFSFQSSGQSLQADSLKAEQLLKKKPYDNAQRYKWAKEAADLFKKHKLTTDYYKAELTARQLKEYDLPTAKYEALKALKTEMQKELEEKNPQLSRIEISLASQLVRIGQAQKAVELLDQLLKNKTLMESLPLKYTLAAHKEMFIAYLDIQDATRALDYINLAIDDATQLDDKEELADALRLKAYLLILTEQVPKAQELLDRSMQLMKEQGYGQYSRELLAFWRVQVTAYYLGGQKDKMIVLSKKTLPYYIQYYGEESQMVLNQYVNLAAYHRDWWVPKEGYSKEERDRIKDQRLDEAVKYSLKAIDLTKKMNITHGVDLSVLYRNLGTIYARRDASKALETFMKSLLCLFPQLDSIEATEVIDIAGKDLICLDYFLAIRSIRLICKQLTKQAEKQPDLIKLRNQWLWQWEAALNVMKKRMSDDALGSFNNLMDRFVKYALELYHKQSVQQDNFTEEDIFRLMELNKNTQLLQSLKSNKASQLGGVSKELLAKEKELKKRMADLEKGILDAAKQAKLDLEKELEEDLTDVRTEYDRFLKNLKKEAPKYFKLKYEANPYSLKDIQNALDEKTAMLEYIVNGRSFYCLSISKNSVKFNVFEYNRDAEFEWEKSLTALRESLTDLQLIKSDGDQAFQNFTKWSHFFYHKVLHLDKVLVDNEVDKLVFIPHGELNFIPFEVLLKEEAKEGDTYANLSYLMKDYAISYSYSASLLLENQKIDRNNSGRLLGFAASYGDSLTTAENRTGSMQNLRKGLEDLPGAKAELKLLSGLYAGDFFFGIEANESNFKTADFKNYDILHLAMHGLVDQENPFASALAFTENGDSLEDNFVYAYELTQMKIPAQLVVLSACETGFGRFEKGNGVASLARSFMYAGVPSLVVSLWQVNDASTAIIMQEFYANLAKGQNKAEALRIAKFEYIKKAAEKNPMAAHPAFWAPFVQLGDTTPLRVKAKNDMSWLWWGIPIATFLIGGLALMFRTRRRAA